MTNVLTCGYWERRITELRTRALAGCDGAFDSEKHARLELAEHLEAQPREVSMNAKSTGKPRPLTVGDCVRLKAGGPQGKIVRASPGGKFRVAWRFLYYSNHSAKNLTRSIDSKEAA